MFELPGQAHKAQPGVLAAVQSMRAETGGNAAAMVQAFYRGLVCLTALSLKVR